MDDQAAGLARETLQQGLARLASRLAAGEAGIEGLVRLSAGASQELWRFDLVAGEARTPLVLRRAPTGGRVALTSIGLELEARLLTAADAVGVPVPKVRHVLTPGDGCGRGFIMSFVEGETLGGRIVKSQALAGARPHLARQCGEILARLHTMDPGDFPDLPRVTPAGLVGQWLGHYRATRRPRPVFDLAFRWLTDHAPAPSGEAILVHGDFRNGNLMIGPDGVRAVLDWELAHVGEPMEDLSWICVSSWRFGVLDKPVGGFGAREDLCAGYAAAGGRQMALDAFKWWEVFGSLRWGVMCAAMPAQFRTTDASVERAVIARRASETEIDLMRLLAG